MSTQPPPPGAPDPNDPTRQMGQPAYGAYGDQPPPGGPPPGQQDSSSRTWIIVLAVGLVLAVGVLIAVLLTGEDEEPAAPAQTSVTVVRPTVTERVETQVQTVTPPPQTVTTPAQTVTVPGVTVPTPEGGAEVP